MLAYFLGSFAGRVATVLSVAVVVLPYALRRNPAACPLRPARYLRRLWPHFWVGYAIAALTLVHLGMVMTEEAWGEFNASASKRNTIGQSAGASTRS